MSLGPYEPNNIYCGECAEMMSHLPDACIDLTVTSPPYDNLRDYKGYTFDFFSIARQLIRVTKPGGVIVWVVADQTVNGSETGTSFKQALYFMAKGVNLHDTMVWFKAFSTPTPARYYSSHEYMFIFSKGAPKTVNLLEDRPSKTAGAKRIKEGKIGKEGRYQMQHRNKYVTPEYGRRFNVWGYWQTKEEAEHAATFPEQLARDHILSWSNPGDLILDPFMGSGTTAKMAMQNGRHYLGFDISPEYVELAKKRVAYANPPLLVVG